MEDSKQYDDIIDVMMMMMTSITTVGIVKVIGECDCNSLTLLLVILDAYHRPPLTTRLVVRNPNCVIACRESHFAI